MKGYRAKSAKEKGTWGEDQRKAGSTFQESSPSEATRDVLNSRAVREMARVNCLPGTPTRNSVPRVFTGERSHRYLVPGTYQKAVLPG